jgi:hypothetical protein
MHLIKEKKNYGPNCRVLSDFALLGGIGNRLKTKDDSKIKREKNLDRHGPGPITNIYHLPGPPSFS